VPKYNNKKTAIDGIVFDSKMEADYYQLLKEQQQTGEVRFIELQPRYMLQPSFKKSGRTIRKIEYVADFLVTLSDGRVQVIDVKGVSTAVFRLKAKLFAYHYPDLELLILTKKNGRWRRLDTAGR
jgi:hypothetical protein